MARTSLSATRIASFDGVGMCRRLKDNTAMADISVVMLSAASPPHPTEPLWGVLLMKPTPPSND